MTDKTCMNILRRYCWKDSICLISSDLDIKSLIVFRFIKVRPEGRFQEWGARGQKCGESSVSQECGHLSYLKSRGAEIGPDQSEASVQVTWSALTNQRPLWELQWPFLGDTAREKNGEKVTAVVKIFYARHKNNHSVYSQEREKNNLVRKRGSEYEDQKNGGRNLGFGGFILWWVKLKQGFLFFWIILACL